MDNRWQSLKPDATKDTPLYLQLARNLTSAIHGGWQVKLCRLNGYCRKLWAYRG